MKQLVLVVEVDRRSDRVWRRNALPAVLKNYLASYKWGLVPVLRDAGFNVKPLYVGVLKPGAVIEGVIVFYEFNAGNIDKAVSLISENLNKKAEWLQVKRYYVSIAEPVLCGGTQ